MSVEQDLRVEGLLARILQKVSEILRRMIAHDVVDDHRLYELDARLHRYHQRQWWMVAVAFVFGALLGYAGWGIR